MRSKLVLFLKSVGKLGLVCLLLFGIGTAFCSVFAYFSGDRSDRVAMEATLILRLHSWHLKSDAQVYAWVAHQQSLSDPHITAAFANYARSNPNWFKRFVESIPEKKRIRFLERIQASMSEQTLDTDNSTG